MVGRERPVWSVRRDRSRSVRHRGTSRPLTMDAGHDRSVRPTWSLRGHRLSTSAWHGASSALEPARSRLPRPRRTLDVIRIERFGPHRANPERSRRIVPQCLSSVFHNLRRSHALLAGLFPQRSASRFAFSRRVFQPLLAAALRFFRPRYPCTSFSAVRWARRRAFSTLRSSRSITAGERTGQT
jgi:hypothetical protein